MNTSNLGSIISTNDNEMDEDSAVSDASLIQLASSSPMAFTENFEQIRDRFENSTQSMISAGLFDLM